jgi:hypothetical protein
MKRLGIWCRAGIALGAISLLAGPAIPQGKGAALSALARLEPGLWQIRDLNDRASIQSICVADPAILTQVQHRNSPCSRVVLADEPNGATVHYTCPAHGFGRTSVRVETSRLAKIDTQGIVDNAPFAYRAEARRVGACGGMAGNFRR